MQQTHTVVPLALRTQSPREAAELLAQVEAEMTLLGWDPAATAIPVMRRRAMNSVFEREAQPAIAPHLDPSTPSL